MTWLDFPVAPDGGPTKIHPKNVFFFLSRISDDHIFQTQPEKNTFEGHEGHEPRKLKLQMVIWDWYWGIQLIQQRIWQI